MQPKLIIFDFDGTLADSFPWFLDVFDTIADRFQFQRLDRSNIDALRHLDARELMRRHGVPLWKVPMIAAHARTLQGRDLDRIRLFDGVADVLGALKAGGVKTAVVTSNARENVETVLGASAAHIDHYACGSSLFGKAAKFKAMMKTLGVMPGDTLAIGDEVRDIDAARACGMRAGAVAWGYSAPERLKADYPDHVFDTPADILSVLDRR
ncbi:MAG: HAD hydrolase-like protein [Asticcacaulis sp.]|nr:HAD hydrolase-like protein [Asticcacaulis sp.]